MKITPDDLKRAFKSHIRRCMPASRQACPSADIIFGVFGDSLSLSDKEKVIDHVTSCCHCLQEFELFLDFHRQEDMAIEKLADYFSRQGIRAISGKQAGTARVFLRPSSKARSRWSWAAASLFAGILMIAILLGIKSMIKVPGVGERGRLPGQIHLIFPVRGQAAKMPLIFRWEKTPRAEYYELEIFDKSLLPLWKSSRIEMTQLAFPVESASQMVINEVYFWTVTAWLTDGTKRESPLEEFRRKE